MDNLVITLKGKIDSNNANEIEQSIKDQIEAGGSAPIVFDLTDLQYVSSAGLRVLLRVRKSHPDMKVINVNSEVYDIFEMTGFTEMMNVEKAYKQLSVDGCEVVGIGANGTVYRLDQDTVVKVYNYPDALADINHEREVARLALILGIPTAISYEVVKVGDKYGSVFELVNAGSFTKILLREPDKLDWIIKEFVELLKKIHSTEVPAGKLPDMKDYVLKICSDLKSYLPEKYHSKLTRMVEDIPDSDHLLHGDYHTKNVMLQGDEVLLIDMDTLSVGSNIFEFAFMYNAFRGYSEYDHDQIMRFQGFSYETGYKIWRDSLALYLGTDDKAVIDDVEDKARIIGYSRMIRGSLRRPEPDNPDQMKEVEMWTKELYELLDHVDTLRIDYSEQTGGNVVNDNELEVDATVENLEAVQAFIESRLELAACPMKVQMQIGLAVEEIYVNIAHYAYAPGTGKAKIIVDITDEPAAVITFIDSGIKYDPLAKEDPDVTLSASERKIGGLGIFLTKKTMDDVSYEYKDGQNIFRMKKIL